MALLTEEELDAEYARSLAINNPRLGYGPTVGMPQGGRVHFPANVPALPTSEWDGGRGLLRGITNAIQGTDVPEGTRLVQTDAGPMYLLPDGRIMLTGPRQGQDVREFASAPPRRTGLLPRATDVDTGEASWAVPRALDALPALGTGGGPAGTLGAGPRRMRARPSHITIDPDALPPVRPPGAPPEAVGSILGHNAPPEPTPVARPRQRPPALLEEPPPAAAPATPPPEAPPPPAAAPVGLAAPAVQSAEDRAAQIEAEKRDRALRAYLDNTSGRAPAVRDVPQGEDVFGLRGFDMEQVPNVPQESMWRYAGRGGAASDETEELIRNPEVRRQYLDIIRRGQGMSGMAWYNMDPVRQAFVRELGERDGNAAFRVLTNNIAAASPRSNIYDNMRNASYYFTQEARGKPLPAEIPNPYGHLAGRLHRQNVEKIRGPGWDLRRNPKPPSFAENLGGNWRPVTVDAHAQAVPAILTRDPRFLESSMRINARGELMDDAEVAAAQAAAAAARAAGLPVPKAYTNLSPRASYDRGVFTMDEAVARSPLWRAAPKERDYGPMERWFTGLADELGIHPAQAQASGWVGGGDISGLTSPPLPAAEILSRVVNRTAVDRNISPQRALREFIRRRRALIALMPGAAVGGAGGLLGEPE